MHVDHIWLAHMLWVASLLVQQPFFMICSATYTYHCTCRDLTVCCLHAASSHVLLCLVRKLTVLYVALPFPSKCCFAIAEAGTSCDGLVVHVQVQTCSNYSAHALPTPTPLVHQDLGFHAQAALPPLLLHSHRLCLRPPLPWSLQLASRSPLHLPPSLNKLPSP